MVYLDSDKPVVLDLPELAAGLRERLGARPDSSAGLSASGTNGAAAAERQEKYLAVAIKEAEAAKTRILADARTQAAQKIAAAEADAAGIRDQAFQEGYQSGLNQGKNQVTALLARLQHDFEQAADQMKQANEQMVDTLEPDVLDLSIGIAEKILAIELNRNDAAFLGLVSAALTHFKQGEKLSVQVSKNDYWRSLVSSAYAANGSAEGITILADESLTDGSCLVESAAGAIDAGVQTQLANIRDALLDGSQETGL